MHTVHACINATHMCLLFLCTVFVSGLSKAETQALTNYGSGEDENEEEEMEEFEAGPVDVQTSLQASADGQAEQEVSVEHWSQRDVFIHNHDFNTLVLVLYKRLTVSWFRGRHPAKPRRLKLNRGV